MPKKITTKPQLTVFDVLPWKDAEKIMWALVHSVGRGLVPLFEPEDLFQELACAACVSAYDPSRGRPSTFLSLLAQSRFARLKSSMNNDCRRALLKSVSLDRTLAEDSTMYNFYPAEAISAETRLIALESGIDPDECHFDRDVEMAERRMFAIRQRIKTVSCPEKIKVLEAELANVTRIHRVNITPASDKPVAERISREEWLLSSSRKQDVARKSRAKSPKPALRKSTAAPALTERQERKRLSSAAWHARMRDDPAYKEKVRRKEAARYERLKNDPAYREKKRKEAKRRQLKRAETAACV